MDSSDPFGPSEGLFTREFYGSCFNALKEDGIMVNQQGSPFYAEDASAMQRSHKRIASTFPISRVYQAHIPTFAAGYWLFGFGPHNILSVFRHGAFKPERPALRRTVVVKSV